MLLCKKKRYYCCYIVYIILILTLDIGFTDSDIVTLSASLNMLQLPQTESLDEIIQDHFSILGILTWQTELSFAESKFGVMLIELC